MPTTSTRACTHITIASCSLATISSLFDAMRRADFIVSSCLSVEEAGRIEGSNAIVVVADDFPLRLDGNSLQGILSRRCDASIVVVTGDPSGYEWLTSLLGAAGRLFILPKQTTGWSMLEHLLLSL